MGFVLICAQKMLTPPSQKNGLKRSFYLKDLPMSAGRAAVTQLKETLAS